MPDRPESTLRWSDPDRPRPTWTIESLEDDVASLVAAHPVLTGLLAYEIVDKEINVETNGYEVATRNTQLVDDLMKLAGKILIGNFKAGRLEPDAKPSNSDKRLQSLRRDLHEIQNRGQEAIDEDLDTVTYGRVTYGDELSSFPDVAGAVISLADFVASGRREDLGSIAETASHMRGMDTFGDDEFKEFLDKVRMPVIRRVLESGPVLGATK